MPLPDPRPLTREEFMRLQERLDYINAHAENDGASFNQANARELLDILNVFYAGMVYYLLRLAEKSIMTVEEARRQLGLTDWRDTNPLFRLTTDGATFRVITHRCTSMRLAPGEFSGGQQIHCAAFRTDDNEMHDTCGEPCRWQMQKAGEGRPPW